MYEKKLLQELHTAIQKKQVKDLEVIGRNEIRFVLENVKSLDHKVQKLVERVRTLVYPVRCTVDFEEGVYAHDFSSALRLSFCFEKPFDYDEPQIDRRLQAYEQLRNFVHGYQQRGLNNMPDYYRALAQLEELKRRMDEENYKDKDGSI